MPVFNVLTNTWQHVPSHILFGGSGPVLQPVSGQQAISVVRQQQPSGHFLAHPVLQPAYSTARQQQPFGNLPTRHILEPANLPTLPAVRQHSPIIPDVQGVYVRLH